MSNELLQAADEARRLLSGFTAVQTVADALAKVGGLQQAQAEADLSSELSRLALGAAERVVETSLDDAAQQRLIDAYISQVGTQN